MKQFYAKTMGMALCIVLCLGSLKAQNVIFSEGFEDTTSPFLPAGWTASSDIWGTLSNINEFDGVDESFTAHSGTMMAGRCWKQGVSEWMFSPGFYLNTGESYDISFWYCAPGWFDSSEFDDFEVCMGQYPNPSAMNHQVFEHTSIPAIHYPFAWTQVTHTFTPTESGVYYLGFHDLPPFGKGICKVFDDILITGNCTSPSNLTVAYDSDCNAELAWDEPLQTLRSIVTPPAYMAYTVIAFDMIAGAQDVTITGIEVEFNSLGTEEVYLFYRTNSSCGNIENSAGWISIGVESIAVTTISPELNPIPFVTSVTIPAGETYGFYIGLCDGLTSNYIGICGGPDFCSANTVSGSNSDLTIKGGSGNILSTGPFDGGFGVEEELNFSGVIHYTVPTNYDIYRDGVLANSSPVATATFHDEGFDTFSSHTWDVKAICLGGGYSDPASETLIACEDDAIREHGEVSFSILPNPAHNTIMITAGSNFHTVEVANFLAQTVLTQPNVGSQTTLDVSNLANGVYFVRIISENGASVQKFVKQ